MSAPGVAAVPEGLAGPEAAPARPFRRRVLDAARIEMLAYVAGQAMRFGSSLVLSRLLFPEAFGLTVIVGLVCQGLSMVTNVGVTQSVVQSRRGDEPLFLNTAFSMMAVRGLLLWLAACVLAWPLALLMHQPELTLLIPAGALTVVLGGLSSTSLATLRRHLKVRPLVVLELAGQALTLLLNVVLAWAFRSVWALIAGMVFSAAFSAVASHFMKVGYRNRFQWDRECWREIYGYGRWIQASSALNFGSSQADRFMMGHYATVAVLGVYNMAVMLSEALSAAVVRITHSVLFPVFSQIQRDDPARLAGAYYQVRAKVDLLTLLPLGAIAALSQVIVNVLFDTRYAEAGWMLQVLCLRTATVCMVSPAETYLFAVGRTKYGFYRDLARTLWLLPAIPLGWAMGGMHGLVWAIALAEIPVALVLWHGQYREGSLRLAREAFGLLAFGAGAAVGSVVSLAWGHFLSHWHLHWH